MRDHFLKLPQIVSDIVLNISTLYLKVLPCKHVLDTVTKIINYYISLL